MKSLFFKDKLIRQYIFKYNNFRFILKNIVNNKNFHNTLRLNAVFKLLTLPRNTSIVRHLNRCLLTNRKKGIIKNYKLSRLSLLKLIRSCQIYGIKKSVW